MTPHEPEPRHNLDRLAGSVLRAAASDRADELPQPTAVEVDGLRDFLASRLDDNASADRHRITSGSPIAPAFADAGTRDRQWAWRTTATAAALAIAAMLVLVLLSDPAGPDDGGDGRDSMAANDNDGTGEPDGGAPDDRQSAADPAEQAVERALDWLVARQQPNGSWKNDVGYKLNFAYQVTHDDADHVGVTAIAGLALIANGHAPGGTGKHSAATHAALAFVSNCVPIGKESYITHQGSRMYSHAFATWFLAEAFAAGTLPESEQLTVSAKLENALRLIVKSQTGHGGWRYSPESRDADLSVTGCQLQALVAASRAGVFQINDAIERGRGYVSRCYRAQENGPGTFLYQADQEFAREGWPLLAIGLASLQAKDPTVFADADGTEHDAMTMIRSLPGRLPALPGDGDRRKQSFEVFYGLFFATRVMVAIRHAHPELVAAWMVDLRQRLIALQILDNHWSDSVGDHYATAMVCLTLALPAGRLALVHDESDGDGDGDGESDHSHQSQRVEWPTVRDQVLAADNPTAFVAALRWRTVTTWRDAFETWISGGGIPMQTTAADWRVRGLLAARQHDVEDALIDLQKAVEMDGNNAVLLGELADVQLRNGDRAEASTVARQSLDRAVALAPGHAGLWLQRARLLMALGMVPEAIRDIDHALTLDPTIADAYRLRAEAFTRLGRLESAMADISRAIELVPDHAGAWDQRGWINAALGNAEAAHADRRRADSLRGWPAWVQSTTTPAWTTNPTQVAEALRFVVRRQSVVPDPGGDAANRAAIAEQQETVARDVMDDLAGRGAFHAWTAASPGSDGVPVIAAFTDAVTGSIRVLERAQVTAAQPGQTVVTAWLLCEVPMSVVLESAPRGYVEAIREHHAKRVRQR